MGVCFEYIVYYKEDSKRELNNEFCFIMILDMIEVLGVEIILYVSLEK